MLLGAHFLRTGSLGLTLVSVLFPLLFLIRKRWSLIAVQLSDYGGAAVWFYTAFTIIQERMILGRSWGASAIILGSVATFSIFAGLLLNSLAVKEKYLS